MQNESTEGNLVSKLVTLSGVLGSHQVLNISQHIDNTSGRPDLTTTRHTISRDCNKQQNINYSDPDLLHWREGSILRKGSMGLHL